MQNMLEALQWRYATKKFDPSKKLTDAQLGLLEEALRLSPSSLGLQPWKFIVVSDPAIRAQLRKAAWDQPQITDASHLFVLAVKKNVDAKAVDDFVNSTAKIRKVGPETLSRLKEMLMGSITSRTPDQAREWGSRQVYIALGILLATAASEGIDACPMEGFDPKKFDEILGLEALGVESRVLAAVGFRASDDPAAQSVKSRFAKDEVIIER
ncbi:NAD(P)H-dependent oxidoreductase [Patescibacteria group bacterium]|nr:NAD(P)H-dependent oxidoreductase [Patescibacteria group bacterium]